MVVPPSAGPLRVVQVGAGAMGQAWLHTLAASSEVELVGLVDLDLGRARAAAEATGHAGVPVATGLTELLGTAPQAVVNVTVPAAHLATNTEALLSGLPVLCEKPVAESVSQALTAAAVAEVSGQLLMVSQSRRYWRHLDAFRAQAVELGRIGTLTCEFFRAPRFGGFREEMAYPLLVDMAIHQFDLARLLLDADPVSVYCESSNPPWSWFAGDAAATATFAFPGGARFVFTGSWAAPGTPTSWNGRWRVSGEHGAAVWDGDGSPVGALGAARAAGSPEPEKQVLAVRTGRGREQIEGSLAEFVAALRSGTVPPTEVHQNVYTLAMVEAAIVSAEAGARVLLAQVLESAYVDAVRASEDPRVREALQAWPSVHEGLAPRS